MKKILISVTSLFGGGAERVVSVWANELNDHGYDVSLLIYGRSENEYTVNSGVSIHTVADSYEEYKKLGMFERLKRMRTIIKTVSPQVMINFLPRMQIWMMLASFGIKTYRIETVRVSPWVVCRNNRAEKLLWKTCFLLADRIVVQTDEQKEYFGKRQQKKCVVIPNPISQKCYESFKRGYAETAERFIAVGRITPQKNYPMMFCAFKKAYDEKPNLRLKIFGAGDDSYKAKLGELICELGMEGVITLAGRSNEIATELCDNDVFLMTSDYEGLPNALIEAMAAGLVCVSTNCRTGPKDLITDGENGFLVNVGDEHKMAAAIIKVTGLKEAEMKEIGKKARETVLYKCSKENSTGRLISLIENGVNYQGR